LATVLPKLAAGAAEGSSAVARSRPLSLRGSDARARGAMQDASPLAAAGALLLEGDGGSNAMSESEKSRMEGSSGARSPSCVVGVAAADGSVCPRPLAERAERAEAGAPAAARAARLRGERADGRGPVVLALSERSGKCAEDAEAAAAEAAAAGSMSTMACAADSAATAEASCAGTAVRLERDVVRARGGGRDGAASGREAAAEACAALGATPAVAAWDADRFVRTPFAA